MNEKQWADLLKYASPYSILVVTFYGRIIELKCPFKVELKYNIATMKEGELVSVEQVKISSSLITVYIIHGEAYYYYHFNIIIE
ncbi:MAG: hypothetical protein V7691_00855 [Galbibacter orientalis]|uniref:hypothetical protein n=1 Tax=Galbibacter orientalis TaxID=453852 RepID=UPI003003338F